MHVLVSEVSLFVEELPYGYLALYPLFGSQAVYVIGGASASTGMPNLDWLGKLYS
jgi:hypothetical protein